MKQKKMITLGNFELLDACLKDASIVQGLSESVIMESIISDYFLPSDKDYRELVSEVLYRSDNGVSLTLEQFTLLVHKVSKIATESITDIMRFASKLELRYRTIISDEKDPLVHALCKRAESIRDLIPKDEWHTWDLLDTIANIERDKAFNSCSYFAQYMNFVADWWDRSVPNPYDGAPDIQISSIHYVFEILSLIFRLSHYPTTPKYRFELAKILKNLKFKE